MIETKMHTQLRVFVRVLPAGERYWEGVMRFAVSWAMWKVHDFCQSGLPTLKSPFHHVPFYARERKHSELPFPVFIFLSSRLSQDRRLPYIYSALSIKHIRPLPPPSSHLVPHTVSRQDAFSHSGHPDHLLPPCMVGPHLHHSSPPSPSSPRAAGRPFCPAALQL
jgi:hypothetical protein